MTFSRTEITELIGKISEADNDGSDYVTRKLRNFNTRFALWSGQSEDGRKHSTNYGRKVFPFENAADTRVFLAESIVKERAVALTNAFFKARVQVQPVEAMDIDRRTAAELILKWLMFTHCLDDLRREVRLAAETRETYGLAIMKIGWQRESRIEVKEFAMEDALQMLEESQDPNLQAMLEVILDPTQEELAAELLGQVIPELGSVKKVREFRDKGIVSWDSPYIFCSKPVWQSLEPWEDVIFPVQADSLQRAEFVAQREMLTEVELRDRANLDGWSNAWVNRAIKHKGDTQRRLDMNTFRSSTFGNEQLRDQIEVWHVYRKTIDEKTKAVRVNCTILSYAITDMVAKHEIMPYEHQLYPFVELPRERSTRPLLESRGVPEIAQTAQEEVKTQRDFRCDRASLAIIPPIKVPANRGKFDLVLGPGVQIPERRPGEISWMAPPPFDQGSIEVERSTRLDIDRYFGRMADGVNPNMAMMSMQDLVDSWLMDMKLCISQTLSLAQQYMTPEEVARVTGNPNSDFVASGEAIRGKFDITAEFDARILDSEALGAKLDYLAKVLVPLDSVGVIDRASLVRYMFQAIDPNLAQLLVKDIGPATAEETENEQTMFAQIAAGTEPPLKSAGQNAGLRLQTLQKIIQSNPAVSARYEADEIFRKMLDARMQAFEFQLQQAQNAVIGRTGAQPALEKMQQQGGLGA